MSNELNALGGSNNSPGKNTSPQLVPHTYGCIGTRSTEIVPNSYGFDLPNDFGTTNATDTYLHVVEYNGNTYHYPPATNNPTTPVVCTDVAAIQSFLNSISPGAVTYTVNAFNEIVLFFANPGDEANWVFWLGTSAPDGYTNKLAVTQHDLLSDVQTYQQVQVVKTLQPNGTFVDRFFIASGDAALTEVTLKPENTFKFGDCPVPCKKEIFATHDRFITVPGIPAGAVAYQMSTNLDSQGLDVNNAYFHLIYPILNGNTSTPIGTQLNDYFTNSTDGILWSDIAGVQAVIDFVMPMMGLSVGDVTYAVNTDNLPIFFLSPDAVTELANSTYLHIYWGPNVAHNSYNEKADVTVLATNSNIMIGGTSKCVPIQQIKEKDSCTGAETYRFIIEDGNGGLVPVTDLYPTFTIADVLAKCPETLLYPYSYEACADDNGTEVMVRVFELRDAAGLVVSRKIETKDGNEVANAILVQCGTCCDTGFTVNRYCESYILSSNPGNNFGWLSGNPQAVGKWATPAVYDLLVTDNGFPALVGAPRNLRYTIAGDINGTAVNSEIVVPVSGGTTAADVAAALNTAVGGNLFVFNTGWGFNYDTAWTTLDIVIVEYCDNHAGGWQNISTIGGWGVRLNAGVLEEAIGVDPNNTANGSWQQCGNCVDL